MQSIRQCVKQLASYSKSAINKTSILSSATNFTRMPTCNVYISAICRNDLRKYKTPTKFLDYNKTVFPPQKPGEERRPAYVCHMKANIKYSPKKMWYIACFVRGMTVDEAVKQLSFMYSKGAEIAKEVILEAQRLAVEEHNVEFKSNLWVAESFSTKSIVIKGIRRHARARMGVVHYRYCHYFVRLEEGPPPKQYYLPHPKTGEELLNDWMKQLHMRKIPNSL
ncbi:39S ribosomal protein L22, mitochondrial [Atta colombica]|uniref:Large ribosomal subunit protein uL22m n=1 Tax=Atta colombica TaxID=520822 RepID=A0A195BVW7_9HYME|nr:PREDICTED: 39S ribosomal protein L22, mitochondrial [Atta colombica]XP_018048763.1 PREDICTED: 39S ribosomal protein L22, mitochondrial [Atta colombica]KYM92774.1 39S ribosomal protein L22, mitochondrial [Atta colombica]